jgi:hypothetical protein
MLTAANANPTTSAAAPHAQADAEHRLYHGPIRAGKKRDAKPNRPSDAEAEQNVCQDRIAPGES